MRDIKVDYYFLFMHPVQEKLLRLIGTKNFGVMTLRDIGRLLGIGEHPQRVKHHLQQLEKRGLIVVDRKQKQIRLVKSGRIGMSSLVAIPILGSADCGPATMFADQMVEGYLRISNRFLPRVEGLFAIKAVGNSMNRASVKGKTIEDGDYVIVNGEKRMPQDGDYVLSVVDGVANIKRYKEDEKNDRIILVSESTEEHPPIYIHFEEFPDYIVNGTIVDVIKSPK